MGTKGFFYSFCVIEIPGGEAFVWVTTFELLFYCSVKPVRYDVRSSACVCVNNYYISTVTMNKANSWERACNTYPETRWSTSCSDSALCSHAAAVSLRPLTGGCRRGAAPGVLRSSGSAAVMAFTLGPKTTFCVPRKRGTHTETGRPVETIQQGGL